MLMILVYNFLDCSCQSSLIYKGVKTIASHHDFGIFARWSEALNINAIPADSPLAISFKHRDCTLSGPLALKGSRFFINHLTASILILIFDISGERGNVVLCILKFSLVKTTELIIQDMSFFSVTNDYNFHVMVLP